MIVGGLLAGHGIEAAVVTAVFLCSLPHAIAATYRLRAAGITPKRVMALWSALALLCGGAAAVTYGLIRHADRRAVAFVLALAGGALNARGAGDRPDPRRPRAGRCPGRHRGIGRLRAGVRGWVEVA